MAKAVAKKTAVARTPVKRAGVGKKGAAKAKSSRAPVATTAVATTAVATTAVATTAVDAQVLAHGLNALLHTMQVVQQSEETLCSLMHALRRGRATGALVRELREALEQLPVHEYVHEVDALRDAVAA